MLRLRILILFLLVSITILPRAYAGTLSCTVTTSCPSGTVVLRLSGTSNAHAELPSQSNYTQLVCCSGVAGLGTSCSGTFATLNKLSSSTNAHVELGTQSNYANSACISVPGGGSVSVGYQASNCTGFDTTVLSISTTNTNGHAGDSSAYTQKVCATATGVSQSLSFSISDNSVGFGTLVSANARFATGDGNGTSTVNTVAHTIEASTNATDGYYITMNGTTLTSGGNTITAIGSTNTASSAGTEQFGMRMTASGGDGVVSSPYEASGYAFDTAAFPDQIASDANGDDIATTYSAIYIGNIAANTDAGEYSSILTYTITAGY